MPADRMMKFGTRAVHSGEEPDLSKSGDVVSPIHLSSTFARRLLEKPTRGLEYSRTGNPTRTALERRLASLEGAKHALAFSSGMAAEATLLLSVLKKGDRVVAGDDLYGGTVRIFETTLRKFGVSFTYVDTRNLKAVRSALERRPAIAWLESPTNPLMHLCDIRSIAKAASRVGAITVVDNTFASPFLQNPLSLGADVVVHSTTKYIGGHSDVVGGALMMSDDELFESVKFNQNAIGAVPSPFDCFLVLRGSKTLHLRMQRHSENAQKVAEFLSRHPKFSAVHYPGLRSHPQLALAKRQMKMPGGMLSAEMKGGLPEIRRFLKELRVFALAESLGGVESLVDHPATMTHASLSAERRKGLGIGDGLVRFSVGIEDPEDLIADLKGALG
ncbi:MAG TPA: PLP-dependent aspartate aminotransferase family protein [Nitrososphaerales archaeon]|nr:PLP-dependent aspartate aminotransferase family protein [Nitrososphaerales archaeon]